MRARTKNMFAILAGLVVGSLVNMALVILGSSLIPPPAGVDVTDVESIKASIHLFETRHFIFPFLAHALGTLAGAFVAFRVATAHKKRFALAIGFAFLLGGIMNLFMLPTPLWFAIVDIVGAYIPMAWLGAALAAKMKK